MQTGEVTDVLQLVSYSQELGADAHDAPSTMTSAAGRHVSRMLQRRSTSQAPPDRQGASKLPAVTQLRDTRLQTSGGAQGEAVV